MTATRVITASLFIGFLAQPAYAALDVNTFGSVLNPVITNVFNPIVELMFAVAILIFVYGVIQLMTHEVGSDEHNRGKRSILWGIIGMFIMVSAWGIVYIVANTVKQI